MSLRRIPNQGKPAGVSGGTKSQNLTKRVVDIILSDNHPAYNSPDDIGVIFFTDVKLNEEYTDPTALPSAKPLNRNNFICPSIGELVQIVETTSNEIYEDLGGDLNSKTLYYTTAINVHNNTTSNSLPTEVRTKKTLSKTEPNIKAFSFKKEFKSTDREKARKELDEYLRGLGYSSGVSDPRAPKYNLLQSAEGDYIFRLEDSEDNNQVAVKLGTYFKENPEQNPLTPSEGDSIIEGKNGQRIRQTTTGPTGINAVSRNVTDVPDDGNPSIGDAAMILSIGKGKQENVTKDAASIYLCENQSISLDAASTNVDSLNSTYTPLSTPLEEISGIPSTIIPQPEVNLEIQPISFDFSTPESESSPLQTLETGSVEIDPVFAALDEAEEAGLINIEDEEFEVAGTELDDEGRRENNEEEEPDIGDGGSQTGDEYQAPENPGDLLIIENYNQYKNWLSNGNGKQDYPLKFIFTKQYGQKEGIVDPKSITDMIAKLKADGVNATNLPNIKHLVCHITATAYTSQHDLMGTFAYTKDWNKVTKKGGWSRHGYNISIDDEGGCNYNVDLINVGYSHGSGGSAYEQNEVQEFGPLTNSNSINMSWIGHIEKPMARTDLQVGGQKYDSKTTTSPNITAKQIYAYERLIKYFVEAFPDIKIVGHNQITINGGYGKSCPGWNHVRFCELIGIPDKNIHKLFPSDFSNQDWELIKGSQSSKTRRGVEANKNSEGRYFQNFKSYKGDKYNRTAEYIYYLTRPTEAV